MNSRGTAFAAGLTSISFYPVSAEELLDLRAEIAAGHGRVAIEDGKFSLAGYRDFLTAHDEGIAAFRAEQALAFAAERRAWDQSGEFRRAS